MQHIHRHITDWYERYGRKTLPWRCTDDPYAIYVSEVMLQQTQVQTVLDRFYHPFLRQFPTLSALADADQSHVLKLWQGLGYYNRAVHLHRAAQITAPALPENVEALEQLPGIGKNTAHAIAAFAFHHPVPVMEANVKRVLARFFALKTPSDSMLWEKAFACLNSDDPFTYNQAMMDIGALCCTAKAPKCALCPLQSSCAGKANPLAYPEKKKKKKTPIRKRDIVVWQDGDRYYMLPRKTRFLHGLYGFVEMEPSDQHRHMALLGEISQVYSHFKLEANVYLAQKIDHPKTDPPIGGEWLKYDQIKHHPISGADEKVVALLV